MFIFQVCYIDLKVSEFDTRTVELIPDAVIIPNKLELLEYIVDVGKVDFEHNENSNLVYLMIIFIL